MRNIIEQCDEKFKSVFVSINFLMPLKASEMSKNTLIAMVLKKACAKYKTEKELEKKLTGLYNTSIGIDVNKYDKLYKIEFNIEIINKKYIKEDILAEATSVINEIINNPYLEDGFFSKEIVEREKINLINKINEEKDNNRSYVIKKLEELLFEDEEYGYPVFGTIEDIEKINEKNLYNSYKNMLVEAKTIVAVSGNISGYDNLGKKINEMIFNKKIEKIENTEKTKKELEKIVPEIVLEKKETNQSVLGIGVKLLNIPKTDFFNGLILNTILGGTPASRMFQNIREKESLAYFAKSIYDASKMAIYILVGIDPSNYEKAKRLIEKEIQELKNGLISEDEIKTAKDYMISNYKELEDKKHLIVKQNILNELFFGEDFKVEEIIKKINLINKEDIVRVASNMNVQKIFLLGGKCDE